MLSSRRALALMAALAFSAGAAPIALATQPAMISSAPKPVTASKRLKFGGMTTASRYGRKGAGISMAQQHRTAAKKRSVARNRRHHR